MVNLVYSCTYSVYRVSESDIIPLPPPSYPDFPTGHTVMACYPETTAFYKATVVQAPAKVSILFLRTQQNPIYYTGYRKVMKSQSVILT
jgi:hypothetical protein